MISFENPFTTIQAMTADDHNCPFSNMEMNTCSASLSSMTIESNRRRLYCSTDNYGDCPFFLSKILRTKYRRVTTFDRPAT